MPRILISAFEPYGGWDENSSWLTLVEFTKSFRRDAAITTRLYPVDFEQVRTRLRQDLAQAYDFALHLGQAPGASNIKLEVVGLNVGGSAEEQPETFRPLVEDGPVAYRSSLPLADWSRALRQEGIPASVSFHAGAFLCNATLYLSHYYAERLVVPTQTAFIHLPLDYSQTAQQRKDFPAMSASMSARALQLIVDQIVRQARAREQELA